MWFAPETASPGTTLAREHPEWLVTKDGGRSGGSLNFGNAAARQHATRFFNAAIKEFGVSIFRTDSGVNTEYLKASAKDPNRIGLAEISHFTGLYRFWDELRAANPGLIIDNCCGGGTRIDLESLARTIPLWRTDGAVWTISWRNPEMTAIQNQVITLSFDRFDPFSQQGMMGGEPYYVRSAFNSGLTFNDDTRRPDFPKEPLRRGIAECKRLRQYVLGDFYPLFSPGPAPGARRLVRLAMGRAGGGQGGDCRLAPRRLALHRPGGAPQGARSPGALPGDPVRELRPQEHQRDVGPGATEPARDDRDGAGVSTGRIRETQSQSRERKIGSRQG